jgi:hypothetical protein
MDGEVHLGQPDSGRGFFLTVEGDLVHRAPAAFFDEVTGLHEHPGGPAGKIGDDAVIRLDDVDDELDKRGRREELAIVLSTLKGEFHQEILVDPAEDIAGRLAQRFAVESAQHGFEQVVVEFLVILRQLAGERFEVLLDGIHRSDQRGAEITAGGKPQQFIVAGDFRQHQRPAANEVGLGDGQAFGELAAGFFPGDPLQHGVVAVGGVAQKNDAEDRHAILAGSEFRIGPELVGGLPERGFDFLDIVQGVVSHESFPPE